MPIVIEKEGKTSSEATISACEELGVARSDIEVEVLQEGSKGVLGIGEKPAKVRVTVKGDNLSEKGLKAKKTLEGLLEYLISSYSVGMSETSDRIKLEINLSDDKGLLIGKRGETLKALEYIVGKISSRNCESGREKKVLIDVDGYITKKEDTVSRRVIDAARRVKRTKKPYTLNRMPAHERRIAYITLKRERGVSYETVIDGDFKKIVITPYRKPKQSL